MTKTYFHVAPGPLEVGSTKPKGHYGDLLKNDSRYVDEDPLGEFLREGIRQTYYPDKPSRLSCSFVFESLEDAETFRTGRGKSEKIFRVQFVREPGSIHRVCWTAWSMAQPNLEQQARQYWADPRVYDSNTELFAEEDLVVLGEA